MKGPYIYFITLMLGPAWPAPSMADDTIIRDDCAGTIDVYFYSTGCSTVPEVEIVDGAVRVRWQGADNAMCHTVAGFGADTQLDVASMSNVTVGLDVTLLSHSECDGRSSVSDVPALVRIGYRSQGGRNRIYRHGFYINGSRRCSDDRDLEGIPAGAIFPYVTPNLAALPDRPVVIGWVEVTLAGYEYDALFDNLCVRGVVAPVEAAKPAPSPETRVASWGAVKALFR